MTDKMMIRELNKIAKEYCGIEDEIVFDYLVESKDALCIIKDNTNYVLYLYSAWNKKMIKSQTFKNQDDAFIKVERKLFHVSKLYSSIATFYNTNPQDDQRFIVYSCSQPVIETGYRDHAYIWEYICKDTLTGKIIKISESEDFSDYDCDYGYHYLYNNWLKRDSINLHIEYLSEKDYHISKWTKPIATAGLPITVNLLKQGIRNLEGQMLK